MEINSKIKIDTINNADILACGYRKKGYFTTLLRYVADVVYPEYSISTHALASSKKGFESCGFKQYTFREFKYGNQWWLRREGKKI